MDLAQSQKIIKILGILSIIAAVFVLIGAAGLIGIGGFGAATMDVNDEEVAGGVVSLMVVGLVNAGIVPLTFVNEADYDSIDQMDELEIPDVRELIGKDEITVINRTKGTSFKVNCQVSERQRDIILAGGLLDYTRESVK